MSMVVKVPAHRSAEWSYIVETLLAEFLGLKYGLEEGPSDQVAIVAEGKTLVMPTTFLGIADDGWLQASSLPETPLKKFSSDALELDLGEIPILYGTDFTLRSTTDSIHLGCDLFGSAFYLLTLYEEMVIPERDKRKRFPAEAALSVRAGFIRRPLVNEYLELLWACMARLWPALQRKRREYSVVPTHDIDVLLTTLNATPKSFLKALAGDLTRRKDIGLAARRVLASLSKGNVERDPCNNYRFILDLSERYNLKSAFFFICGVRPEVIRSHYDPMHPVVLSALKQISDRGHEIGLHPGYGTFTDGAVLQAEFEALQSSVDAAKVPQAFFGGRQHGLQWENPTTWRLWDEAGLIFDSSVGFAAAPGFRSGTCYPYRVFDLEQRRHLDLIERPLVAMDTSYEEYLKMTPEAAHTDIVQLAETCKRYGGEFVGLWHNNRLLTGSQQTWYERTLKAIA